MNKNNSYGLRNTVLKELSDGFYCIQHNFKYLKALSKTSQNVLGATEWLLDNIYLIEKEYKSIKLSMPFDYFKGLFIISESNEHDENKVPRVFEMAKNYINKGGGD